VPERGRPSGDRRCGRAARERRFSGNRRPFPGEIGILRGICGDSMPVLTGGELEIVVDGQGIALPGSGSRGGVMALAEKSNRDGGDRRPALRAGGLPSRPSLGLPRAMRRGHDAHLSAVAEPRGRKG
jgi:hypothetical protein